MTVENTARFRRLDRWRQRNLEKHFGTARRNRQVRNRQRQAGLWRLNKTKPEQVEGLPGRTRDPASPTRFPTPVGKNATDSAMIIDAMDLLHRGRFSSFCIVSSDGDSHDWPRASGNKASLSMVSGRTSASLLH